MKTRYLMAALCLSAGPAAAIDEASFLVACDGAIASRQTIPQLYKRLSATAEVRRFSRTDYEAFLDKMEAPEKLRIANLQKFDAGDLQPTAISFVVDYEATSPDSTIVRKRSLCEYWLNRETDQPEQDLVVVDGTPQIVWEAGK